MLEILNLWSSSKRRGISVLLFTLVVFKESSKRCVVLISITSATSRNNMFLVKMRRFRCSGVKIR